MAKTDDLPPLSVTGIGYVDGLLGANCRHSIGPGSGGFNPWEKYDSEANRIREELEQKQRALERRIRQTRRQVMAARTALDAAEDAATRAAMQELYQRKARLLKRQNAEYGAFCKENGLRTKDERLAVAKWDRRQASAATAAARKAEREERAELEKYSKYRYNENGTIIVTDDWTKKDHPHIPVKYKPYAVIETVTGKEKQRDRTIYGPDARQRLQVHSGPHSNPKMHPYGEHGEHVHRIVWEDDKIVSRKKDDLTDAEKKEHKDII